MILPIFESKIKQFQSELLLFAVMSRFEIDTEPLVNPMLRKFSMPPVKKSKRVVKTMISSGKKMSHTGALYTAYLFRGQKTTIPEVSKSFASRAAASSSAPHRFHRHAVRPLGENLHSDFEDFEILSMDDVTE